MDDPRFGQHLLRWQLALTALGLAGWYFFCGVPFALSFLVGALMAGFSFWLLYRLTFSLGTDQKPRAAAVFGAFRLLATAAVVSAILRSYELQTTAAGTGILIVVLSILLEVVRKQSHGT